GAVLLDQHPAAAGIGREGPGAGALGVDHEPAGTAQHDVVNVGRSQAHRTEAVPGGAVRATREPVLQRPGDGLLDEAAPAGTGRTIGAAAVLKKPPPGLAMDLDS